jgi:hypothetical protein
MVPLANPASTRAGRPQDAAAVETAIQRGVIVPARRVVEMVEDRIDGAHTNYVHNARQGGQLLLVLLLCAVLAWRETGIRRGSVPGSIDPNCPTG